MTTQTTANSQSVDPVKAATTRHKHVFWAYLAALSFAFLVTAGSTAWLWVTSGKELEAVRSEGLKGTAEANERTARVEGVNLTLRESVEKERIERLKIESLVQPRSLSVVAQKEMADELRPFKGRSVKIRSYFPDPEGMVLAWQLKDVLTHAGITALWAGGSITGSSDMVLGVNSQDVVLR